MFQVFNNLVFFRYLLKLSQSDLASLCDLSKNTISAIENGSVPSLTHAFDIVDALSKEYFAQGNSIPFNFLDVFYPYCDSLKDFRFVFVSYPFVLAFEKEICYFNSIYSPIFYRLEDQVMMMDRFDEFYELESIFSRTPQIFLMF